MEDLVKRLRDTGDDWPACLVVLEAEAADKIEALTAALADKERELEAARDELRSSDPNYTPLLDGYSEQCQRLSDRLAAAERGQKDALAQMCQTARELGEMKGKLEGSEMAGVVDGWRERATTAEARVKELEKMCADWKREEESDVQTMRDLRARLAKACEVLDELLNTEGGVPKKSIMNFCYSVFMIAKGKNSEDGGPTDWFNDTKPTVEKWVSEIRARATLQEIG